MSGIALTSSSTSVAVSKRPSSRAPACAILMKVAAKIAADSATPGCFLFDIKEPSNIAGSLPQDRGSRRLQIAENAHRLGFTMMRAIVISEPFRRQLHLRMQRPDRFQ